MEYSFRIKNIYCYPNYQNLDNVVFTVLWDYIGTDNTYTFDVPGSTAIPFDQNNSYTPYENLTEVQVTDWINQYTESSVLDEAKALIAYRIQEASKPPEVINPVLPW
jgi:hypothetical protein